jgi:hypothetical protein
MSRQARLDAPDTFHHAIGRGNEGATIFRSPEDRERFPARWRSEAGCGASAAIAGVDRYLR